jgi:hypothetical protein
MVRNGLKRTPQAGLRSIKDWHAHRLPRSHAAIEYNRLPSSFTVENPLANKSNVCE